MGSLGALFGGVCAGDHSAAIDFDTLRRYCNFGYARGYCKRAGQSDADAVRMMVKARRGELVEIAWSVERDHHPVAVGCMEIDMNSVANPTGDVLACQAHACAAAYFGKNGSG